MIDQILLMNPACCLPNQFVRVINAILNMQDLAFFYVTLWLSHIPKPLLLRSALIKTLNTPSFRSSEIN